MHRVLGRARNQRWAQYLADLAPTLFLQELFERPATIGALCPSSRTLAARMAAQVPLNDGLVIELGAGTGVVTHALLERGVAPDRLIVLELSPRFSHRLRKRYSQLEIITGNAADLGQLIPAGKKVSAIVSSLPLCSLPATVTQAILSQWQPLLAHGGVAVQFTYSPRTPKWQQQLAARQISTSKVWTNLPPATVARFSF